MGIALDLQKKLRGFELDIAWQTMGRRMGILGASGSGKSMTLRCIAGIEKPDRGSIVIKQSEERRLYDSHQKINLLPQQRKVGYLFQNYALFPNMTVAENVGIGLKRNSADREHRIQAQIQRFHLKGLEARYPAQLSGGQQQRVALARIFAYEPDVLLLDEPFSALDSFLKDQLLQELVESLKGFQGDMILVSHSRDEVYTLCDEMMVMDQGKTIIEGETKALFKRPQKMEAARLTGCKNISPIQKIGDYELLATNWQVVLKTKEKISDTVRYVGVRAHDLQIIEEGPPNFIETENMMEAEIVGDVAYPFEQQYLLKNKKAENITPLYMKIQKTKQTVGKHITIQIPAEALILLE